MRRFEFAMLVLLLLSLPAQSAVVGDVEIPDEVRLGESEQRLILNGAGVRKKFFISVYVAALYLPQPQRDVKALLQSPPANRVLMHFVYSKVAKPKMDEGWREGFANNLEAPVLAAVTERLERFVALFGDMREGDQVWLDYRPGTGTTVTINGESRATIEGADFNAALLGVWLGEEPVTDELKNALVGDDNR